MLNLIQVQERLRDMPMQAIMQYANGSNPMIPPFLALGELNRRKKMQESAAAEQAKEMAGAPSVKDQIEQATGLMALQGARQRQASQQQAGMQARMDMPAPNTMTSEPAQMASGGAVSDVMQRDYRGGGIAMNPDMMRKMAMMKAMRRPGLAGIPVQNMFKRGDYAGGGIVAFAGKDESLVPDPDEDQSNPLRELLQELLTKRREVNPADDRELLRRTDSRNENYSNEGRAYPPGTRREPPPSKKPDDMGIATLPTGRVVGTPRTGSATARALALKPEDVYQAKEPRSFEEILAERRGREKLMGIDESFMDERERRLQAIEEADRAARANQPMDRLTSFLTGIAQSRRGAKFGEAGAAGVVSSDKLAAEQRALNRKQDMDMAELRYTIAEKRNAQRRGDMGKVEDLINKEEDLKRKVMEDRAAMTMKQAQVETQAAQANANMLQATRPTEYMLQREAYMRHAAETGEKPTELGFQRFMLGSKASTIMTPEDAIRIAAASLGQGATEDQIKAFAQNLLNMARGMGQPGSGGQGGGTTVPSGVKVTREK